MTLILGRGLDDAATPVELTTSFGLALKAKRTTRRSGVEPARRRYGWYIDRRGFGPDRYDAGREALLTQAGGGLTSAGERLGASWVPARQALAGLAGEDDLHRVVSGELPLPIEDPTVAKQTNQHTTREPTTFGHAPSPHETEGATKLPLDMPPGIGSHTITARPRGSSTVQSSSCLGITWIASWPHWIRVVSTRPSTLIFTSATQVGALQQTLEPGTPGCTTTWNRVQAYSPTTDTAWEAALSNHNG